VVQEGATVHPGSCTEGACGAGVLQSNQCNVVLWGPGPGVYSPGQGNCVGAWCVSNLSVTRCVAPAGPECVQNNGNGALRGKSTREGEWAINVINAKNVESNGATNGPNNYTEESEENSSSVGEGGVGWEGAAGAGRWVGRVWGGLSNHKVVRGGGNGGHVGGVGPLGWWGGMRKEWAEYNWGGLKAWGAVQSTGGQNQGKGGQ